MTFVLCMVGGFPFMLIGLLALFKWRDLKRNKQISQLEDAMRKAANENLVNAKETLLIVSFCFTYDKFELPKYFWEIKNLTLIARTLRTCIKIFLSKYTGEELLSTQKEVYERLSQDFVKFAKTDLGKAMAVLVILCAIDKVAASMMADYLAQNSKRSWVYVEPFVA